jgi:hypothetical protein
MPNPSKDDRLLRARSRVVALARVGTRRHFGAQIPVAFNALQR